MQESRTQPLLHRVGFVKRIVIHSVMAVALLFGSLAIGIAGYAHFESRGWYHGFLNYAMLFGGLGPVVPLTRMEAKSSPVYTPDTRA
jgi:hypothetical protein